MYISVNYLLVPKSGGLYIVAYINLVARINLMARINLIARIIHYQPITRLAQVATQILQRLPLMLNTTITQFIRFLNLYNHLAYKISHAYIVYEIKHQGLKDQFYIAFLSLLQKKYIYTRYFSMARRRERQRGGLILVGVITIGERKGIRQEGLWAQLQNDSKLLGYYVSRIRSYIKQFKQRGSSI